MITFDYFKKDNYENLFDMLKEFYSSDAVDHPLPDNITKKLLDDIISGNHPVQGIEIFYNHQLVGFGIMTKYYASEVAGTTIQLEDLYIKKDYRGKGIAKKYFKEVMDRNPDASRFRLEVAKDNEKAIKLYKNLGFNFLEYSQMTLDKI